MSRIPVARGFPLTKGVRAIRLVYKASLIGADDGRAGRIDLAIRTAVL
jgi:hypothetical protein